MKKIIIIMTLLVASIGVFGWWYPTSAELPLLEGEVQRPMQSISSDMKTQRTLSWESVLSGDLELRKQNESEIIRISGDSIEIPSFQGKKLHRTRVHLSGLSPGTTYEYRIVIENRYSSWYSFKTEPEQVVSFKAIIFGDSQAADYRVWGNTARAAWERNPDAVLAIGMGDQVDNGQEDYQWRVWLDEARPLLGSIPFAPTLGNHESYSLNWEFALPETYLALYNLPSNGPEGLRGHAYSYDYGEVHFVVLDSQIQELGQWYPDLLERQKAWLEQDLSQTTQKWKVVMVHRPVWQLRQNGYSDIGRTFISVFDDYQVDLVLTAHVHSYSRTFPYRKGEVTPGGTYYVSTGRSGDRVWPNSPIKAQDEVFYNPIDQPNYLTLEATSESLTVKAWHLDGSEIDTLEILK